MTIREIISRQDALGRGLRYYFTGLACPAGHVSNRLSSTSSCVDCQRAHQAKYRAKRDPVAVKKAKAAAARYRAKNKDKIREATNDWRARNAERVRRVSRERRQNLPADVRKACARKGAGLPVPTRLEPTLCECCGRPPGNKGMHLDHDHQTGAFRGWLCQTCNTGIGMLGDSEVAVYLALEYLRRARALSEVA